jgi:hypothetical protein
MTRRKREITKQVLSSINSTLRKIAALKPGYIYMTQTRLAVHARKIVPNHHTIAKTTRTRTSIKTKISDVVWAKLSEGDGR